MRIAEILLALVLVLLAGRKGAAGGFVVEWGEQQFGIQDYYFYAEEAPPVDCDRITFLLMGPLGLVEVPFTATQGLIGGGLPMAIGVALTAVCWRRRRGVS
jgi:hypothetical protein